MSAAGPRRAERSQEARTSRRGLAELQPSVDRVPLFERIPRLVSVSLFAGLLVLVWQAIVWLELTSEFILPPPAEVASEFGSMMGSLFTGGFVWDQFWITVKEVLLGLLLATVAGIGLGVLVAETSFGRAVVSPFLVAAYTAPKVAFAPIFVAWFGFGIWAKVVMAAFIAFFPLLVATVSGLVGINMEQDKLFRSIRASSFQKFMKLKVPSALPFIFAGLKTAAVLSVVGAIVGEFLGGGQGMGSLIRIAGSRLAIARVFAFVGILSILGFLLYALTEWAEKRIVFWRKTTSAPEATA